MIILNYKLQFEREYTSFQKISIQSFTKEQNFDKNLAQISHFSPRIHDY